MSEFTKAACEFLSTYELNHGCLLSAGGQNNINDLLKMTRPSPLLRSTQRSNGHEATLTETIVEGLLRLRTLVSKP